MATAPDARLSGRAGEPSPRVLVIRRDNIGDLVCTLPLLRAMRDAHPHAWIGVLANSYNAALLERHPDVNEVFVYRKLKHRGGGGLLGLAADRVRMIRALRARRLDDVILATPDYQPRTVQLARWLGAERVIGFAPASPAPGLDVVVPLAAAERKHEVERVMLLGEAFGLKGGPMPARIYPDPREVMHIRAGLAARSRDIQRPIVGVHISARKPSQRWPAERFAALMRELYEERGIGFVLFWAPGAADNPLHPGDDVKAQEVHTRLVGVPCLRWPTETLPGLIGALAECDHVICADGGAMHLAAALGKPIVALFGKSDVQRWRPWGVPHEVLQAPSQEVNDIPVERVAAAYEMLTTRLSLLAAG